MSALSCFAMPNPVKITGRSSSITNSFVNSLIPLVPPTEAEVAEALAILGLSWSDLRCAYCGNAATEWDHLRPLVRAKRPTGFISEIANLVPACGKCNQSKGSQPWEAWMRGKALRSPSTRGIVDVEQRVERLRAYEQWREPTVIDFELAAGNDLWERHWQNNARLLELMRECQTTADAIRMRVLASEA